MINNTPPLLEVRNLHVELPNNAAKRLFAQPPLIKILKHISFQINSGESLGLVGESGSGKTTLGRTLLGLYKPSAGQILFQDQDITHFTNQQLRNSRADLQIIFQDPLASLNPRHRIITILTQPLWAFQRLSSKQQARQAARELLSTVGLPANLLNRYPHELSGGQRQRVGIARAIALKPKVLVADEIVSGLDVSSQAQILQLLKQLKDDLDLALIFISHDLCVVRVLCDRVAVLRQGEIIESNTCANLFAQPKAQYTRELLAAIPLPIVEPDWLDRSSNELTSYPVTTSVVKEESFMQITNCTALVTGANRGIGRVFVELLIAHGAKKVYAGTRDKEAVAELVATHPGKVLAVKLDICDFEHIANAVGYCSDINLLINNAGVNHTQALLASDDLGAARDEMNVNYFGTLAMCRAFAPILRNNSGGAIINMLSILSKVNLPLMGSLCASKAASLSMTQGIRAELASQNTKVIAVMPGAVDTDMSKDFPPPKMPASEVATAALDALTTGTEDVYPGDMASGVMQGLQSDDKAIEKELAQYLPQQQALAVAPPEPDPIHSGGCFCQAIRFEVQGREFHSTDCQCSICRSTSGAESVKWFTVPKAKFHFTSGEPAKFRSSQQGLRTFCPQCGTALTCEVDVYPDDIDVAAVSFDSPATLNPATLNKN